MAKNTLIAMDGDALKYIKAGVDAIYEPVRRTFGPEAGTTLMYRTFNRGPRNVDDGFYTAEVILPKNPFVRLVAEFVKEAVKRTNEKVGDGTTGTAIVMGVLFNDIYSRNQAKAKGYTAGEEKKNKQIGFMELKREILAEAVKVKEKIRAVSKDVKNVTDLEKISAISLGGESELSKIVAQMAFEVGKDGFIDVVEGHKGEVEHELIKGARFFGKTCGKAFINKPERHEMVVEDTDVFITNHKLDNDMLARFVVAKLNKTKLTIIAPDFTEEVLVNMILARQNGTWIFPIKAPGLRTEQMEDLAVYFDAVLVNKDEGMELKNITGQELGYLDKIIVKDVEAREDIVALGGKGEKTKKVQERIKVLQGQLAETKESQFKKLLERRIASLASGGGVIRVGSPTDAETLPLKLKVEDCVFACKAAIKSGYVEGGGLTLKKIAEELPEDHVLKHALIAPYKQIQENAGGSLKVGKNVIDPTDAIYYAVDHATSVVASLITVKNLVPEEPELAPEEGSVKIAKAISSLVVAWRQKEGLLKGSETQAEQDRLGGLTEDEFISVNGE